MPEGVDLLYTSTALLVASCLIIGIVAGLDPDADIWWISFTIACLIGLVGGIMFITYIITGG